MWAPRATSAGTSRASSPRRAASLGVADTQTDLLGCVDKSSVLESSAHRFSSSRVEDENETDSDWRVGGFDVFERRSSPLRRKRAPLTPSEFDHEELVLSALQQARGGCGGEKAVGVKNRDPTETKRVPLRALVPGNASLHRRVSVEARVRERSRRGLSFDDIEVITPATLTTRTPTASDASPQSEASSAWSAQTRETTRRLHDFTTGIDAASRSEDEGLRLFDESMSSEESARAQKQRDARRRHRKRLAQIVVAQWRWFARDALENLPSKMHFFWRTKRRAFVFWRNFVGEEASLKALRLVAAERERRLKNTLRAFEEKKAEGTREGNLRVSLHSSTSEDVFETYAFLDANRFVAETTAAAAVCFRRWRTHARSKSQKKTRAKEMNALAEARAASSRIAKKRSLVRTWRDVARRKKKRRRAEEEIVAASSSFFNANVKRASFVKWRKVVRDDKTKRALLIARLDRDRAFRFCLSAFIAWRDEYAKPRAVRRVAKNRARDFFRNTFLQKTFDAWRFDSTPLLRHDRLTKKRVWDVFDALVQSARWRAGVAAAFEAGKTERRLKSVVAAWRDVARDAAREEKAETFLRTVVKKRILRDVFFGSFANPSDEARDARRADAYSVTRRAVVSLRLWRTLVERRRNRDTRKSRAKTFRESKIVAASFSVWRGPFVLRARAKRLESRKLARALATRDALVKCRAFIGWSYRSRVVGRAKRRLGKDALRHRNAFLATRAFSGWVSLTEASRASDALSDAKLATAQAALAATMTGRVFDAWLEYAKNKMARRSVSAFAVRRFVTNTFSRALLLWKARVERKKASRERLVVAMDHYDRRRLSFTALEAWVVFLVRRRLKRANEQKAFEHYRVENQRTRGALGKSVVAWIGWVEARRKKRDAIRDALELHKVDVIRHACAAWLREGLRRRELRRERSLLSVADDAARRTAEVWRVVFRCAERWRSVVRRRARRRGDGVLSLPARFNRFDYVGGSNRSSLDLRASSGSVSSSIVEPPVMKGFRGDLKRDDDAEASLGTVAAAERAEVRFPEAAAAPFAPRRRPPPRRLDGDANDAPRRDGSFGPSPVPGRPPRAPLADRAPLSSQQRSEPTDGSRTNTNDPSETDELVLSPSSLDAHERCICEFEALKAESARIKDELMALDSLVAKEKINNSVASVRRASLATAARLAKEKRAVFLPAVRAAAAALGEYRSDMATSVASGW